MVIHLPDTIIDTLICRLFMSLSSEYHAMSQGLGILKLDLFVIVAVLNNHLGDFTLIGSFDPAS